MHHVLPKASESIRQRLRLLRRCTGCSAVRPSHGGTYPPWAKYFHYLTGPRFQCVGCLFSLFLCLTAQILQHIALPVGQAVAVDGNVKLQ